MTVAKAKTERIDIRTTPAVKQTLQQAAAASHKSVSEFLLDAALAAATEALIERRVFRLDDERWRAFQETLDRPVTYKRRLAKLLTTPGVAE